MAAKAAPQPPMPHTQGAPPATDASGARGDQAMTSGDKRRVPLSPTLLQGGERVAGRAQQAGRVA